MERRVLGHTGVEVSRVCLGAMTFGGQTGRDDAARMVEMALDAGVNFFDTANVYTGGESERMLGAILGSRRKDVVLASKVGFKTADEVQGLARETILGAVDRSLARLGTEWLDFYYLHVPDYSVPLEETLEAGWRLVQSGKVRHIAVSNYASWQVARMFAISEREGWTAPSVSQPMYNVLARRIEDEYLPMCREYGVATVVYNPLAGGLLTGKHSGASGPLPGTRFDGNKMYLDRFWNERNFEAVGRLSEVASAAGRSLVSVALGWLLHHSAANCVILGASKVAHLEANLAACAEGPLAPETVAGCDEVWGMVRGAAPKYNR